MRMLLAARIPPLALVLCVFGCSGIGEDDKADSRSGQLRTMTGSEIRQLLTGNTVLGRDELGSFWMHYPSEDTVWGLASNGDVDIGRWRISGNYYCRAWRRWRGGKEQCWLFASDGSSQLLWIEPDGRSSAESTIEAGNTIGRTTGRQVAAVEMITSDVEPNVEPLGEDVPVDAAGIVLVARELADGRGGEPSGIDSGTGGGRGGAGGPSQDPAGGGNTDGSGVTGGSDGTGGAGGTGGSGGSGGAGGAGGQGGVGGDDGDDRDGDGDGDRHGNGDGDDGDD